MKCPLCRQPFIRVRRVNFSVRHCPQCLGYLVDYDRLATIKRSTERSVEELMQEAEATAGIDSLERLRCPQCLEFMRKQLIPPPAEFHIDLCRACNLTWFDGGELASYILHYRISDQGREAEELRRRHEQMSPQRRAEFQQQLDQLPSSGDNPLDGRF
jgi:Zn-finger nucleic acid-binding protein